MLVEEMVLHVIDTVRFVGAELGARLLNTGLADPSSSDTAALSLLNVVAKVPDPGAGFLGSLAPEVPGKQPANHLLILNGHRRHGWPL